YQIRSVLLTVKHLHNEIHFMHYCLCLLHYRGRDTPCPSCRSTCVREPGPQQCPFPVPSSMTVEQGQAKCGDQAQLSCCNKATYAGDTTDVNSGALGGLLSHLIGSGSGATGLGLFDQCSKLDARIGLLVSAQDILNQHCKQNVACCANSPSNAGHNVIGAGLPCISLGSIL
ncbi:Hydrophobin, partial [Penicillium viridicatum]